MFSQMFSKAADTVTKNLWYLPIQEFILSEKTGFQLAKTKTLLKQRLYLLSSLKTQVQVILVDKRTSVHSFYTLT